MRKQGYCYSFWSKFWSIFYYFNTKLPYSKLVNYCFYRQSFFQFLSFFLPNLYYFYPNFWPCKDYDSKVPYIVRSLQLKFFFYFHFFYEPISLKVAHNV